MSTKSTKDASAFPDFMKAVTGATSTIPGLIGAGVGGSLGGAIAGPTGEMIGRGLGGLVGSGGNIADPSDDSAPKFASSGRVPSVDVVTEAESTSAIKSWRGKQGLNREE